MFIICYYDGRDICRVMDTDDLTCEMVSFEELHSSGIYAHYGGYGLSSLPMHKDFGLVVRKRMWRWSIDGITVSIYRGRTGGIRVNGHELPSCGLSGLQCLDYAVRLCGHIVLGLLMFDKSYMHVAVSYSGDVAGADYKGAIYGDAKLMGKVALLCL